MWGGVEVYSKTHNSTELSDYTHTSSTKISVSTHNSLGRISSETRSTILFKNEFDIDRLNVPNEKRCVTAA
jgi:hypothetical protein